MHGLPVVERSAWPGLASVGVSAFRGLPLFLFGRVPTGFTSCAALQFASGDHQCCWEQQTAQVQAESSLQHTATATQLTLAM